MPPVELSTRTDDVDWDALKAALVADRFDNGRTPQEYRRSHLRSHAVVVGRLGQDYVANGRILSDGVCNAYLVDIWTATAHRRQGIGRQVVEMLVATVPGQHVALLTDDQADFYATLGFAPQDGAMSLVAGSWLNRDQQAQASGSSGP
jgi:ribosomal protein S18 acetylase RimI-like enzyme